MKKPIPNFCVVLWTFAEHNFVCIMFYKYIISSAEKWYFIIEIYFNMEHKLMRFNYYFFLCYLKMPFFLLNSSRMYRKSLWFFICIQLNGFVFLFSHSSFLLLLYFFLIITSLYCFPGTFHLCCCVFYDKKLFYSVNNLT